MKPQEGRMAADAEQTPRLYQVEDGWIETYTGQQFFFKHAADQEIRLADVAHSLSMQCRYNGHTLRFYSVAEHAVLLALAAERDGRTPLECLTMLHHDDGEYIISDLPRPIKVLLPAFKAAEAQVETAVARAFGTIYPFPDWLKDMDTRALVDERRQAMSASGHEWGTDGMEPVGIVLRFWGPSEAKEMFLWMHNRLAGRCTPKPS
jgi:hypothetical protein